MRTTIATTTTEVGHPPDLELGRRDRTASDSGAFWRGASPELRTAIARHNARVGTLLQRSVSGFFRIYVFGPIFWAALRVFLRVRVIGAENLVDERWRAIFAIRHFFEWDPFISYWGSLFPAAFWRPYLTPITLAGHFWTTTPEALRGYHRFTQLRAFELAERRARDLARTLAGEIVANWNRFRGQAAH